MTYEVEVELLIACGFDPQYAAWNARQFGRIWK